MILEKITSVDLIEVTENGCVQIRSKTTIFENERPISETFHRRVITPGDDYSDEDARVRAICAAVHTEEVIAAYENAQED